MGITIGARRKSGRSRAPAGRSSTSSRASGRGGETEGTLVTDAPKKAGSIAYSASGMTKAGVASASWTATALPAALPQLGVSFETEPLGADTEGTGPVTLVLRGAGTTP